jgi:hypothetical protein
MAKKRTTKAKMAKPARKKAKTAMKPGKRKTRKSRARRTADQGFWANFFGAFAGPSSGR